MGSATDDPLAELSRRSAHWRRLASGALPWAVSEEIEVAAKEIDREVSQRAAQHRRDDPFLIGPMRCGVGSKARRAPSSGKKWT